MIIVALLALLLVVINVVVNILSGFPPFPHEALDFMRQALPYMSDGIKILNSFTHAEVVIPLLVVELAVFETYRAYRVFMWVAEHVPMLGVKG